MVTSGDHNARQPVENDGPVKNDGPVSSSRAS